MDETSVKESAVRVTDRRCWCALCAALLAVCLTASAAFLVYDGPSRWRSAVLSVIDAPGEWQEWLWDHFRVDVTLIAQTAQRLGWIGASAATPLTRREALDLREKRRSARAAALLEFKLEELATPPPPTPPVVVLVWSQRTPIWFGNVREGTQAKCGVPCKITYDRRMLDQHTMVDGLALMLDRLSLEDPIPAKAASLPAVGITWENLLNQQRDVS